MEIVVNTYGAHIKRENEAFVVTTDDECIRLPAAQVSAIHVSRSVGLTSDAILLALENDICIFFDAKYGKPLGMLWNTRYGSVATIRKGQLMFSLSESAVVWTKGVLSQKISSQEQLLLQMSDRYSSSEKMRMGGYIKRMEYFRRNILRTDGRRIEEIASRLRGLEGMASKLYFECMNHLLPSDLRFNERSQHPARDTVNAMLNYGYGIMYGIIHVELIKSGIDPFVGILHKDNYNKPVLVYDVIELYRTWIDEVIFTIAIKDGTDADTWCSVSDGASWLEDAGRRKVTLSVNEFLAEVVTLDGKSRSRRSHIALYCQRLAKSFKKEYDSDYEKK